MDPAPVNIEDVLKKEIKYDLNIPLIKRNGKKFIGLISLYKEIAKVFRKEGLRVSERGYKKFEYGTQRFHDIEIFGMYQEDNYFLKGVFKRLDEYFPDKFYKEYELIKKDNIVVSYVVLERYGVYVDIPKSLKIGVYMTGGGFVERKGFCGKNTF